MKSIREVVTCNHRLGCNSKDKSEIYYQQLHRSVQMKKQFGDKALDRDRRTIRRIRKNRFGSLQGQTSKRKKESLFYMIYRHRTLRQKNRDIELKQASKYETNTGNYARELLAKQQKDAKTHYTDLIVNL